VLAATSVCFDLSVFELFVTLSTGGAVILADSVLTSVAPRRIARELVNTVPSAMAELVANGLPSSVRTRTSRASRSRRRSNASMLHSVERVYDLYGRGGHDVPTFNRRRGEFATIAITANTMRTCSTSGAHRVHRGAGRISRWSGIAPYLNRPELSRRRFVVDSFAPACRRRHRRHRTATACAGAPTARSSIWAGWTSW
jgi:non-ribosomal peptide synthetase component F